MKRSRMLSWLTFASVVAVASGYVAQKLSTSKQLADKASAYSASPPHPVRRLLIVGDSTGVGTGADNPQDSVAGRISTAHPSWLIDNLATNGAKFQDLLLQLEGTQRRYDLILVLAGGNDVIRLTPINKLKTQIAKAVHLAQARAPMVVLMPSGNVGHAPFFPPPLSWLMSSRSKTLHEIAQQIASETGARYVRLLKPPAQDPFSLEPQRMHADDGLHPSSDGYALWFEELERQGGLAPAPK